MECSVCHEKKVVAGVLGICVDCLRRGVNVDMRKAHMDARAGFHLPLEVPISGIRACRICSNSCNIEDGGRGYCGIWGVSGGRLRSEVEDGTAFVHFYRDPLPTNCCSAWFCPGTERGCYNLAVFFYGCNFNCLFCQNYSHKGIGRATRVSIGEMVESCLEPRVKCICFFGGSPEPQMPYALKVCREVIESGDKRICWEWNGGGNHRLVMKASEFSLNSGGNIKFDIKAWNNGVHQALCGVSNQQTLENFRVVAEEIFLKRSEPVLSASTLLVPGYVDEVEVEGIARFIGEMNKEIPYTLLAFHPDFQMYDLPFTSRRQAEDCLRAARKHLNNVHLGNKGIIGLPRDLIV